jgi:hypothetical protein
MTADPFFRWSAGIFLWTRCKTIYVYPVRKLGSCLNFLRRSWDRSDVNKLDIACESTLIRCRARMKPHAPPYGETMSLSEFTETRSRIVMVIYSTIISFWKWVFVSPLAQLIILNPIRGVKQNQSELAVLPRPIWAPILYFRIVRGAQNTSNIPEWLICSRMTQRFRKNSQL